MLVYWGQVKFFLSPVKLCIGGLQQTAVSCSGVPEGGFGVFNTPPPPEIPKFWQSRNGLQIERKMFSVPIPTS
jgi:hypothetical protein